MSSTLVEERTIIENGVPVKVREEKTINTEEYVPVEGESDGQVEFITTTDTGKEGMLKTHTSQKEQPIGVAEEINEIHQDNSKATIANTNSNTLFIFNDNGGMRI